MDIFSSRCWSIMVQARAESIAASLSETQFYIGQINQHLFVYLGDGGASISLSIFSSSICLCPPLPMLPCVTQPRLAPIKHPLQGARGGASRRISKS